MIERYSREEVKKIWQDHNRYKIWLDIELAAALAMEKYKLITKGVYKKVKSPPLTFWIDVRNYELGITINMNNNTKTRFVIEVSWIGFQPIIQELDYKV